MAQDAWLPECGICFTPFGPTPGAVPRVLVSCGHSLCESCIARLAVRWPLASPPIHTPDPAPPHQHAAESSSSGAGPGPGGSVTVRCAECGVTSLSLAPPGHLASRGALAVGFPRNIELLRVIDALAPTLTRPEGVIPAQEGDRVAGIRGENVGGGSPGASAWTGAGTGAGTQQGAEARGATVPLPGVPRVTNVKLGSQGTSELPGKQRNGGHEPRVPGTGPPSVGPNGTPLGRPAEGHGSQQALSAEGREPRSEAGCPEAVGPSGSPFAIGRSAASGGEGVGEPGRQRSPEPAADSESSGQPAPVCPRDLGNSKLGRHDAETQGQSASPGPRLQGEPAGKGREGGGGEATGENREGGLGEQVVIEGLDGASWVCHRDVISVALVLDLGESPVGAGAMGSKNDSRVLVTASFDKFVRFWSLPSMQELATEHAPVLHSHRITSLAAVGPARHCSPPRRRVGPLQEEGPCFASERRAEGVGQPAASGEEGGPGPRGEGMCVVSADSGGHFQGFWVRHVQQGAQRLQPPGDGAAPMAAGPCAGNGGALAGAGAHGGGSAAALGAPLAAAPGQRGLQLHQWGAWNEPQDWRFSGVLALAAAPSPGAHCDPPQPSQSDPESVDWGGGRPVLYSGSGDRTVKAWLLPPWKDMLGAHPGAAGNDAPDRDGVHELAVMRGHTAPVCALGIPPSQPGAFPALPLLYSAAWDGTVRVWWRPSHSPLAVLDQSPPRWPLPLALPTPVPKAATEAGCTEPGRVGGHQGTSNAAASAAAASGVPAASPGIAGAAVGGVSVRASPIRALALAHVQAGGRTAAPECLVFCGTDSGHVWAWAGAEVAGVFQAHVKAVTGLHSLPGAQVLAVAFADGSLQLLRWSVEETATQHSTSSSAGGTGGSSHEACSTDITQACSTDITQGSGHDNIKGSTGGAGGAQSAEGSGSRASTSAQPQGRGGAQGRGDSGGAALGGSAVWRVHMELIVSEAEPLPAQGCGVTKSTGVGTNSGSAITNSANVITSSAGVITALVSAPAVLRGARERSTGPELSPVRGGVSVGAEEGCQESLLAHLILGSSRGRLCIKELLRRPLAPK